MLLGVLQYDHVEFAGAVPRSFIPPFLLAKLSEPLLRLASQLGAVRDGLDAQMAGAHPLYVPEPNPAA